MRKVEVVVVSDLHLGTYGSHAGEFVDYFSSIDPEIIVLNGDIMDIWQFKKSYFPPDHWEALKCLMNKAASGSTVYYLTGNHDDALRRFSEITLGNFHLLDKLVLTLNDKKHWFFHGDVFDASVHHSQWIAKLGGKTYDWLIRLNRFINIIRSKFNLSPVSFSKKIKSNIKKAVQFIDDFEHTAIDLAFQSGYDYVVCGHIHQPKINLIRRGQQSLTYMNSGDWVEHLTALEYDQDQWRLYDHLQQFVQDTARQFNTSSSTEG